MSMTKSTSGFIEYSPPELSEDLETSTNVISVNTKPATPQYTKTFNFEMPSDRRIKVYSIASPLQITIDAISGTLYVALKVNDKDMNYLSPTEFTTTGTKMVYGGNSAREPEEYDNFDESGQVKVEMFFWVSGGGSATLSLVKPFAILGVSLGAMPKYPTKIVEFLSKKNYRATVTIFIEAYNKAQKLYGHYTTDEDTYLEIAGTNVMPIAITDLADMETRLVSYTFDLHTWGLLMRMGVVATEGNLDIHLFALSLVK